MSLFEDERYVYRDTFFVLFESANRPTTEQVEKMLKALGDKYEPASLRSSEGFFESVTIRSPHDSSAMDITLVQGEEVVEQVAELYAEFRGSTLAGDDLDKLKKLSHCNARFDVFHFEQVSMGTDDEEMVDPGGLLLVMERLAATCDGLGIDPQSKVML